MGILKSLQDWWQRHRCSHYHTAVHTFIENKNGPLVRRQPVCLDCGKRGGYLPPLDDKVIVGLLEEARRLADGDRQLRSKTKTPQLTVQRKVEDLMDREEALREVHWALSCRFTAEMSRLEKDNPDMKVEEMRSETQLAGRVLKAIRLLEELHPELGEGGG